MVGSRECNQSGRPTVPSSSRPRFHESVGLGLGDQDFTSIPGRARSEVFKMSVRSGRSSLRTFPTYCRSGQPSMSDFPI